VPASIYKKVIRTAGFGIVQIHHTRVAPPMTLSGNCIATPQPSSNPLAYDLMKADQNWIAQGSKIASVFIEVEWGCEDQLISALKLTLATSK